MNAIGSTLTCVLFQAFSLSLFLIVVFHRLAERAGKDIPAASIILGSISLNVALNNPILIHSHSWMKHQKNNIQNGRSGGENRHKAYSKVPINRIFQRL